MKTTFDGDIVHYSPVAAISIASVFLMTERDPEMDKTEQAKFAMAPHLDVFTQNYDPEAPPEE